MINAVYTVLGVDASRRSAKKERRSGREESRVPEMQLPDRWLAVLVYDAPDYLRDETENTDIRLPGLRNVVLPTVRV